MKAEIILTDNNINIDLNEPTIDVSTEDGFSVTIIGGVGPQGNRGPEGPKGEKGNDYVLTEEDKDDIAQMAAEKVDLTEYVRKTDYATSSAAGVVKVAGLGVKVNDGELVLSPASSRQIKQGIGDTAPIIAVKEHEAVFYGLAKAAGDESQKASENAVGVYTDAAKTAIRAMLGTPAIDDIPSVPVKDVRVSGGSIVIDGIANIPLAVDGAGIVRIGSTAYGLSIVDNPNHQDYGIIKLFPANDTDVKTGTRSSRAIDPAHQHQAVFYGLAKAAGDETQKESDNGVGTYTEAAKTAIRSMLGVPSTEDIPDVPVQDVQIDGASVLNGGVANIPIGSGSSLGVLRVAAGGSSTGLSIQPDGRISVYPAQEAAIKNGDTGYAPIMGSKQHMAVFYGLAKAAGADEKNSTNPVGTYSAYAKSAIRAMIGLDDQSIIDIVETGLPAAEEVEW